MACRAGAAPSLPWEVASISSSTNQIRDPNWSYDAAGNVLSAPGQTIAYDAENRQVAFCSTAANPPVCASYAYDGLGNRVQRTDTSGNTTTYVYDAFGSLAAEYNGTQAATGTQYVTLDHLGSTRLVMGSTGNERHDYLPFGYDLGQSAGTSGTWRAGGGLGYGADTVRQKFTGQEGDEESAPLDYFNARYYSLAQGRFASVDPGNAGANLMDPQSWSGYGYVSNNPLRYTDPRSLSEIDSPAGGEQTGTFVY